MGQTAAPNIELTEDPNYDLSTREGLEAHAKELLAVIQQVEVTMDGAGTHGLNDTKRLLTELSDVEGKTIQVDPSSGGIRVTDVATGDYTDSVVSVAREVTDENGNVTVEGDTPVIDEANLVTVVENGQPQLENLESSANLLNPDNAQSVEQTATQDTETTQRVEQESRDQVARITQDEQIKQAMEGGPLAIIMAFFQAMAGGENPIEAMMNMFKPAEETEILESAFDIPENAEERAELFEENDQKMDENNEKISENLAKIEENATPEGNAALLAENEQLLADNAELVAENEAIIKYDEVLEAQQRLEMFAENRAAIDANAAAIQDNQDNGITEGNQALLDENQRLLDENEELLRDGEEPSNDSAESNLTGVNNSASTYTYNDGTSGVGEPTVNLDEGTVEISGQSGSSAFNSISNPDESTISQVDARVDPNADAGNDLEGQDNTTDAQIVMGMMR